MAAITAALPVPLQLPYGLLAIIQFPRQALHCLIFNGQIDAHAPHRAQQLCLLLGGRGRPGPVAEQRQRGLGL